MMPAVEFAAAFAALAASHQAADYWVQTPGQALEKGLSGWKGRRACLAHVATYTATQAGFLAIAGLVLDVPFSVAAVAAGLAVSAATHYFADRRAPLRCLAARLGKGGFWDSDGGPLLDQAWHWTWLWVAALVIAGVSA
ncbi:MAG TPA: transcriptional regulator [Trebonia sp.]|nr:transcriptional regulator [Trebonia sp.]